VCVRERESNRDREREIERVCVRERAKESVRAKEDQFCFRVSGFGFRVSG